MYIYIAKLIECSPMAWATGIQSQVESYQRLKNGIDAVLLNTQHYKVRSKSKLKQSREKSSTLP